jgi:NDP-sugar pyrophosphorylase family protein
MLTLIPLAGKSARFRMAGFAQPKALLPMPDGSTMLERILDSLAPTKLITVAMREDQRALAAVLRQVALFEEFEWRPIWLDRRPDGPLDSVLQAKKWLRTDDELLISYCDCFLGRGAGYFTQHLRAVAERQAGIVGVMSEDERLSKLPATAMRAGGVFWFRHAHEFVGRAKALPITDSVGVPDVVYRFQRWTAYDGTGDYVDLGTPEDYQRFMAEGMRA